jgi:MoaA/NifB/PqqE/SkfB family radical SAM enzyme
MKTFLPDLVIEVTGACNKACKGCYAPNVVSGETPEALFEKRPELFLGIVELNRSFLAVEEIIGITSIRGGEPTLHPSLPLILTMAKCHARQVILETHGKWLLEEKRSNLLQSIKDNKVIVKISFDKMHGTKADDLRKMTDILDHEGIQYWIAITEESLTDFLETRNLCYWVESDSIIFQPKASNESELMRPTLGTVNVRGEFSSTLTHKFEALA